MTTALGGSGTGQQIGHAYLATGSVKVGEIVDMATSTTRYVLPGIDDPMVEIVPGAGGRAYGVAQADGKAGDNVPILTRGPTLALVAGGSIATMTNVVPGAGVSGTTFTTGVAGDPGLLLEDSDPTNVTQRHVWVDFTGTIRA